MRISVEDLVATQVDNKEEETRELKLTYWVGQVGALYEDYDGSKKFTMRFFDQASQWRYHNDEDSRLVKLFGNSFRRHEVMETDVCEENDVDIIVKKLNWWSDEEKAVTDNQGLKASEISNGLFSDRMIIRCGSDGVRRSDLSDSLWPAPEGRRRNRLLVQCPNSKLSLKSISGPQYKYKTAVPVEDSSADDDPKYTRAVEALKLSVLPENLPCREQETASIREFLRTAVGTTGSSGNVLYISGVPGTGKTASVLSVVKQMQNSLSFEFVYINSMKLNTPTDIYSDLINKLYIHKRRFKADKPQEKLAEFFSSNSKEDKNRPVTVLLVDEIDYLVTKSQAVVYQLFDWPLLPESKLVLLTISNTMDLPERLMPRVASRLGLARLNYMPYQHEQIRKVILERMKDAKAESVFGDDAVQLLSRRVAASSGDIRKALHICRRAIEMREGAVVRASDINNAQFDLYSNPWVAVMAHQPYLARLVLVSLVLETSTKNTDSILLRELWLRFSNLLTTYSPIYRFRPFYYSDFVRVVTDMKRMSLIETTRQTQSSLSAYMQERKETPIDTPAEDDELVLQKAGIKQVNKKLVGNKQVSSKVMAKDNGADEDEDGSGYIVSLNPNIEVGDVKKALVEEAGDRVAQRFLN